MLLQSLKFRFLWKDNVPKGLNKSKRSARICLLSETISVADLPCVLGPLKQNRVGSPMSERRAMILRNTSLDNNKKN